VFVNDVYYSYSTDNGSSWSPNMRISDESSNRKIGSWWSRCPPGPLPFSFFVALATPDVVNATKNEKGGRPFSALGGGRLLMMLVSHVAPPSPDLNMNRSDGGSGASSGPPTGASLVKA
jgi:hypothetical protein